MLRTVTNRDTGQPVAFIDVNHVREALGAIRALGLDTRSHAHGPFRWQDFRDHRRVGAKHDAGRDSRTFDSWSLIVRDDGEAEVQHVDDAAEPAVVCRGRVVPATGLVGLSFEPDEDGAAYLAGSSEQAIRDNAAVIILSWRLTDSMRRAVGLDPQPEAHQIATLTRSLETMRRWA